MVDWNGQNKKLGLQGQRSRLLEPTNHLLPATEFGSESELLTHLGKGNDPIAVMMTCWELGSAPDQIAHAREGEVVVVQNPGGLVSPKGSDDNFVGSVMLGLSVPTVKHLIVCGHTMCRTLALVLTDERKGEANRIRNRLRNVSERLRTVYADRPQSDWLRILVQETILQQIANLRSHASIESRLKAGDVLLHAWLRDDQRSTITAYDPTSGQFSE